VKFQVKNALGAPLQLATAPGFTKKLIGSTCDTKTDVEDAIVDTTTSGTTYRWDSSLQGYIYNFSTKGLANGEWRIYAPLPDDTATKSVDICLTK
jgi:hypothetical protein